MVGETRGNQRRALNLYLFVSSPKPSSKQDCTPLLSGLHSIMITFHVTSKYVRAFTKNESIREHQQGWCFLAVLFFCVLSQILHSEKAEKKILLVQCHFSRINGLLCDGPIFFFSQYSPHNTGVFWTDSGYLSGNCSPTVNNFARSTKKN